MNFRLQLAPSELAEAAAMVREHHANGTSLLPIGRASRLARHLEGTTTDCESLSTISVAGCDRIIEINPAEQTCVVEAGVSPLQLGQAVAEYGLELGVICPNQAEGTIGGIFMAPEISLYRGKWGNPREQVLSADWILADGSTITTGARVVKSVAGYDLTRLILGSRGQLALCTQLCLRLRTRPRYSVWLSLPLSCGEQLPDPRFLELLFSCQNGDCYWLRADELAITPAPAMTMHSPEEGNEALQQVLSDFAGSPRRFTSSKLSDLDPGLGAVDFLGRQQACQLQPASLSNLGSSFPRTFEMPWLEQIRSAICPTATHFGGAGVTA